MLHCATIKINVSVVLETFTDPPSSTKTSTNFLEWKFSGNSAEIETLRNILTLGN